MNLRNLFSERGGRRIDLVAGLDAVEREPMEIRFQRVGDLVAVAAGDGFVERFHVVDFEDYAVLVDEGDGERDQRVLHPEGRGGDFGLKENHAVVVAEFRAIHETALLLLRCRGDFGIQRRFADVQGDFRERSNVIRRADLRVAGKRGRHEKSEQSGDEDSCLPL